MVSLNALMMFVRVLFGTKQVSKCLNTRYTPYTRFSNARIYFLYLQVADENEELRENA